ncbi:hypothetical protein L596_002528 [Steinernema carpocapsae]|uniref:Sushi domain-containing protein n=1 Tax=Steinernema carpocapsae TaxID=34508 RepID=A0A4U8UQ14_STECR|nr:hypothetical protein L596_002528 [Steinernema carpocapsae]
MVPEQPCATMARGTTWKSANATPWVGLAFQNSQLWPSGCPPLSSIDNGVIEYATGARHLIEDSPKSYDSGSRAHLVCKNGTRVKGGHEAVCQCNEQWKPNLGKCT